MGSHRLLVVHAHAREGGADVGHRVLRHGVGVVPLRVHVDQTHLCRPQRLFKLAVAVVPLVVHCKKRVLRAPSDRVAENKHSNRDRTCPHDVPAG